MDVGNKSNEESGIKAVFSRSTCGLMSAGMRLGAENKIPLWLFGFLY